jgi:two-component system sensor histidine kinase/response regulator
MPDMTATSLRTRAHRLSPPIWRDLPVTTRGYIVAVASVLVAAGVTFLLRGFFERTTFILFAAPIAVAAWYGGKGPAVLALLLGLFAIDLVAGGQSYGVIPTDSRIIIGMGLYLLVGVVIVHTSNLVRVSRDESQAYASQLEEQAMELELQTAELEQQNLEGQSLNEELEEAHELLKVQSQSQLAEAQALARLGSWEWDIRGDKVTWSDEMYRLYGLEPGSAEVDYDFFQSLVHPDDREIASEVVQHALATGQPFSFDHRVIRADGLERLFHARGKVILGDDGAPVRMLGTGQDVTDSRRAEAALRVATEYAARQATAEAAAQHLNRVFSQAPVLIAVLGGPEHRFEQINEAGRRMLVADRLLGRSVREAFPSLAEQGFGPLLDDVYRTNEPYVGKEVYAHVGTADEGKGGYFNFVFQPLSNDDGVYAVLVVATDVSDLVSARILAEESQREAVAASRAKSDFLARMSHELRTPLAAIIGYGELLADGITGPVNDEQKKQLHRIRSSANHLLAIIDEILTLARMEAGKEKVDMREVEIDELIESVASMAEPLAAAKGLTFEFRTSHPGLALTTDEIKLRQVLLNLISNAVKYTDTGTVSLVIDKDSAGVHFLVNDTGVGVEERHLEKIFEPFWQVEETTTRRAGGTGLGLAVTRQFVDLLGGRIGVTSEPGEGSSFRVSLPPG